MKTQNIFELTQELDDKIEKLCMLEAKINMVKKMQQSLYKQASDVITEN